MYNNNKLFMNINKLISVINKKLQTDVKFESLIVEDKSFLHRNHKGYQEGKYHLKLTIKSKELAELNKIISTKKIYTILEFELKNYIHSIQILFL